MKDDTKLNLLTMLPGWAVRRLMRPRYLRMIAGGGEAELAELPRIVRKQDLAIDVGCNLGIYSFALSQLADRVIAFEPIPLLARFMRKQGLPGVTVEQIALSSSDGAGELCVPENGAAYASLRADAPTDQGSRLQVVTRSLDSLDLGRIGFMKVDVEGFEEVVLNGARATITRDKPRLLVEIEERHNQGGLARIVAMLAALGYTCHFLNGGQWHAFSEFDLDRDQNPANLENPQAGARYINNFLFMPAGEMLAEA